MVYGGMSRRMGEEWEKDREMKKRIERRWRWCMGWIDRGIWWNE